MDWAFLYEAIGVLSRNNAFFCFLALGVVLILIDYYFPVDWPAYVGYLCFGFAVFFALTEVLLVSAIAGSLVFLTMLAMHFLFFSRYLTNAPGATRASSAKAEGS
jgi:hypothetical protein